ncbi:MAG: NTP transferase domain-containing protein [Ardenticatenaceae bacterium]|nr:NTP transferase domain-containing protein [Ardenticatenaceae bacterium]
MNTIPVVIFCGGQGTRMRGGTLTKKELVEIDGRPILWHVMRIYSTYGFNRFVLPLGYGADQIKNYFLNYEAMTSDFTIQLGAAAKHVTYHHATPHPIWDVSLVDTGVHTEKASRIARVADYLHADRFFLTYGDGVADVDVQAVLDFHLAHGKLGTITAVQPQRYQYGIIESDETGLITDYVQYPQLPHWINAGFMVFERAFLDWVGNGDDVAFETAVLPQLIAAGQVMVYHHHGFWQSMDTLKDAMDLEQIWQQSQPWKVWQD